ncbi:MAG: hypothetical protein KDD25_04090, partial [Bdellovibrionales bacterium]|nr:hypothetical protein [Bdellovibrionales bacterium]
MRGVIAAIRVLSRDFLVALLIVSLFPIHGFHFEANIAEAQTNEQSSESIEYRSIDSWDLLDQVMVGTETYNITNLEELSVRTSYEFSHYSAQRVAVEETYWGRAFSDPQRIQNQSIRLDNENGVFPQLIYKEEVIWQLGRPVATAFRYGKYLVFIDIEDVGKTEFSLKFVDLEFFQPAIGKKNTGLGVFQLPVKLETPLENLSLKEGRVAINDTEFSSDVFDYFSFLQAQTWNIQGNLLDGSTYEELGPLIESIWEEFESSQELVSEKVMNSVFSSGVEKEKLEEIKGHLKQRLLSAQNQAKADSKADRISISTDLTDELIAESDEAKAKIAETIRLHKSSRKLLGRIGLLWSKITTPRPMAARSITDSIAFVVSGMKGPKGESAWKVREGALSLAHHPLTKIGLAASAALVAGTFFPESSIHFVEQILNLGSFTIDKLKAFNSEMFGLLKESFFSNGLLNPKQIWQAYVVEGPFSHFLVANQILILKILKTFGITHLAVNIWDLVKDLKSGQSVSNSETMKRFNESRALGNGWWKSVWSAVKGLSFSETRELIKAVGQDFTTRQKEEKSTYLQLQAKAQNSDSTTEFTEEENERALQMVAERLEAEKTWVGRFFDKIKSAVGMSKIKNKTSYEISSFRQAFSNFLFSWNSLEHTYKFLTPIWWKFIFLSRSFIPWRPFTALGLLYYPEAFRVRTANGINGKSVTLTEANGGTRPAWSKIYLKIRSWYGDDTYSRLREWEEKIIPIETRLLEEAHRRAYKRTLREMLKDNPSENITKLSQSQSSMEALSKKNQKFYQQS